MTNYVIDSSYMINVGRQHHITDTFESHSVEEATHPHKHTHIYIFILIF